MPDRTGAIHSAETKAKISEKARGRIPWNKGKEAEKFVLPALWQRNQGQNELLSVAQ